MPDLDGMNLVVIIFIAVIVAILIAASLAVAVVTVLARNLQGAILYDACVCHTCCKQFKRKQYRRTLSMLMLGVRGVYWDFWHDAKGKGIFHGCGKCPHCKSKDTALYNR